MLYSIYTAKFTEKHLFLNCDQKVVMFESVIWPVLDSTTFMLHNSKRLSFAGSGVPVLPRSVKLSCFFKIILFFNEFFFFEAAFSFDVEPLVWPFFSSWLDVDATTESIWYFCLGVSTDVMSWFRMALSL